MPIGREKPFERLSSKEREAFELASEILQWSSDPRIISWPGVSLLREEATKLYELVSNMDMEHDDRYYKVHDEMARLNIRYTELKTMIEGRMHDRDVLRARFDPVKDEVGAVLESVRRALDRGVNHIELQRLNEVGVFSDVFWIKVKRLAQTEAEKSVAMFEFYVNEMFNGFEYLKPSYAEAIRKMVETYFAKSIYDVARVYERRHDFGGIQFEFTLPRISGEDVESLMSSILEVVKKCPRKHMPKR